MLLYSGSAWHRLKWIAKTKNTKSVSNDILEKSTQEVELFSFSNFRNARLWCGV